MAQSEARIRITATDETRQAFDSVRSNLDKVKQSAEGFRVALGRGGLLGAAAGLGAVLVQQTRSVVNLADSLDDLSQRTGVAVEALSKLRVAPELADVSLEQLTTGLKEFNQSLVEASDQSSRAAQVFRALGVDISGNTEQSLANTAAAFSRLEDGALKSTLATQLFGRQGLAFIPLLNTGSEGLAKAAAQAEKLGVVISSDFARQAGEFNDNLARIKTSVTGLALSIANPLLPKVNSLAEAFLKLREGGAGAQKVMDDTTAASARLIARLTAFRGGGPAFEALANIAGGLTRSEPAGNVATGVIGRPAAPPPDTAALTCVASGGRWDGTRCNAPAPVRAAGGGGRAAGSGGLDARTRSLLANMAPDDEVGVGVIVSELRAFTQERAAEQAAQIEGLVSDTLIRRTLQLQQNVDLLNEALRDGKVSPTEYAQAMQRLVDPTDQAGEAARRLSGDIDALFGQTAIARARELQKIIDEVNRQATAGTRNRAEADQVIEGLVGSTRVQTQRTNDFARDLGLTFTSAFEGAISGGRGLRDILKGIESDLLKIGTRELVTKPFLGFLSDTFGSAAGGGAGGILSSIVGAFGFGGARAMGGPVMAGMGYLVGERGPEIFRPGQSGSIVPNNAIGGMNVTVNVSARDVNSFRGSESQIAASVAGSLARAQRRNG
jgi:hypothetical protein